MSYTLVGWADSPSTATPTDAANFAHMDAGIAANDTAVTALNTNAVQLGTGNLAATPVKIIVVGPDSSHLPPAGHKGLIAFVVPFSLP